jgi:DNA polymerase III alpha subunit
MLFINGSDEFGRIELVLFPLVYTRYSNIKNGDIILVKGRVEKRMSSYQLVVSELKILP